MRIALAGISHETNTYCQGLTIADDFHVWRGEKLLTTAGQQSDVGGAVDACLRFDLEPVPILFAHAQPSGVIERQTYEDFKAEILRGLEAAGKLDGCVLLLHGAGVVEGIDDLEGDLAAAVRQTLGDTPIAASFDLHGNVTQFMADQLNGVFACHQYPHIDLHERAEEAVACVTEMARTGQRASCHVIHLPMLTPTTTTFVGVGQDMLASLLEHEAQAGCLDLSWFHGFPYADVAHVGSMVVVSAYEPEMAAGLSHAKAFATSLWEAREQFRPISIDGDEAVRQAQSYDSFPVVIHETSDNCGGGTPGDGTHLLRAMLNAGLGGQACFAFIVDPETAAAAHAAGVGHEIDVRLGGKTDDLHGQPIEARAYVKALHDGKLIMQHMFKGARLHLGPLARLVIDGMDIVVGSRRSQTFDREPFLAVGIDVMKYRYVALKSSNHFRAGFQHLASAIVTADTPGLSTHKLDVFPRQKAPPLWPLQESVEFIAT